MSILSVSKQQRLWQDCMFVQACLNSHCLPMLCFVLFDSLCPSKQFFSYVGMGLPGLNLY